MADGINKALSMVRRVARQGPRIVADALPLLTIGATVAQVGAVDNWQPVPMMIHLAQKYTGINVTDGTFKKEQFMQGGGSLIIASGARWLLKQFA